MVTRPGSLGVILFWAASMAWLTWHDVRPAWTAQDVPKFTAGDWLTEDNTHSQARIEDKYGHHIGTAWSVYTRTRTRLSRRELIWLERFPGLPISRIRIEISSEFNEKGDLDEMTLELFGAGQPIKLTGENFSGSLAFQLWIGRHDQLFKVDGSAAGMVADVFRPFPPLPKIEVGQSWRMHVVNPLAAITGWGSRFMPMLVRVTGKQRIRTPQGMVECFLVETERARAWVNAEGLPLRQEMDLPYGGTLAIIAETFDAERLAEVRAMKL